MKSNRLTIAMLGLAVALALIVPRTAAADDAAALYKGKCAACHGADGNASPVGKKMGARDFTSPDIQKMTEAQMIEITTKGKEKMPAYDKKLTAEQIKSLVEYVRSLSKPKK